MTSTSDLPAGRHRVRARVAATVLMALLVGCAPAGADDLPGATSAPSTPVVPPMVSPGPRTSATPAPVVPAGTAAGALASLPIKGRAPRTGYDRSLFGQRWADTDRDGCDTRNDVLRRDLSDLVLDPATNGCVVLSGTLVDPFSGSSLAFRRGQVTSRAVQVDHVVALSDAWQKGAQQWSPAQRLAFANDPLNLLAVDGPLNAQKSDGDAATWLPPQRSFRCAYVARQVAVKAKYLAWVTQAEHGAIAALLASCPGEPLPTGGPPVEPQPEPEPESEPATAPPGGAGCDPAYPGVCIAAPDEAGGDLDCGDVPDRRFVVLAPDPHRFDGDGDGLGCEPG